MYMESQQLLKRLFQLSIILILPAVLFNSCADETSESQENNTAIPVITAETEYRNLSGAFTVSAEVIAYQRVYIPSRLSSIVENVHFEEGDRVERGDLLVKLDTRQHEIDLRRAQSALEEVRESYNRTKQLFDREVATRAEFAAAERNLEEAKSEVDQLELMIEFGEIRSPISGVVTSRLVEIGNSVGVNERVFTVANLDLMVTRPGVSELNLTNLKEGQATKIRLDVYPDEVFDGTIRRIFPERNPDSRLYTVEVEIERNEQQPEVRPGLLARTTFNAGSDSEVITIPTEAVLVDDDSYYLFIINDDNTVTRSEIEIGIQRQGYTEIKSDISANSSVAAGNIESLHDGAAIERVGTFRRHGFRN